MKTLCFIGVIFEEKLENQIVEIKNSIKEKFSCEHAMKTKPHITLHEPISVEDIEKFWEERTGNLGDFGSFQINLKKFGHFDDRVLYIDVEKNGRLENLYELVREKSSLNYKPHVTLAHRDILDFYSLWSYYEKREFFETTKIENLVLFTHDRKRWNIEKRLKL